MAVILINKAQQCRYLMIFRRITEMYGFFFVPRFATVMLFHLQ